jgi:Cu(I)/Ag(I) efflux system membrane fusion protein
MKVKAIVLALVAVGAVGAGGYGLYSAGIDQGRKLAAPAPSGTAPANAAGNTAGGGLVDPATGKRVLYWHDPMVPGQKFDKPGKSPFMDMQLVPVYAEDAGNEGGVSINPRVQQNLGIRTAEVMKANLSPAVEAVGSVAYNERDLVLVQARSNGFVERLYVRAPLDAVRKGQPLVQLYVPDWVAAQEEYLSVKRMNGTGAEAFVDAARQRMRLAGMTDDHIRLVETTGKVQARMTLTAPVAGVVAELAVREGMTVMSGAPLFRINGLSTVWVNAEVPENAAAQVRPGNVVEARTPSLPGTVFKGKVSAILPEVDPTTRTLKARVELANSGSQLVPGMFATVNFTPNTRKDVLTVPSEAVIATGKRSVVMIAQGDGRFTPVDVEVGIEVDGKTEIRTGLEAGQKVVVSGQFLIDSEASLKGTITRMGEAPTAAQGAKGGDQLHRGQGKVESIDKEEIVLSHEPIPSLQWGAMTMGFKLPPQGLPKGIAEGDSVTFQIRPRKDGTYEVASIGPSDASPASDAKGEMKDGTRMPAKPAGAAK